MGDEEVGVVDIDGDYLVFRVIGFEEPAVVGYEKAFDGDGVVVESCDDDVVDEVFRSRERVVSEDADRVVGDSGGH